MIHWHRIRTIYFHIICECNSCETDCPVLKIKNIYSLFLYSKFAYLTFLVSCASLFVCLFFVNCVLSNSFCQLPLKFQVCFVSREKINMLKLFLYCNNKKLIKWKHSIISFSAIKLLFLSHMIKVTTALHIND